jgi:hypothetical protein
MTRAQMNSDFAVVRANSRLQAAALPITVKFKAFIIFSASRRVNGRPNTIFYAEYSILSLLYSFIRYWLLVVRNDEGAIRIIREMRYTRGDALLVFFKFFKLVPISLVIFSFSPHFLHAGIMQIIRETAAPISQLAGGRYRTHNYNEIGL